MLHHAHVHIGMTKTGTTSIQLGMAAQRRELRQRGICYPNIGYNHGRRIGSLFVDDPNNWRPNTSFGIDAEQLIPETWRKLNSALSSQPEMLVLSGEALFGMPLTAITRMVDWLRSITVNFRIIIYFREPKEWANSSASQQLKSGKPLERVLRLPPLPRIRERLERWIAICGKENISVFDFNVARQHAVGIGGHFVEQIGLGDFAEKMGHIHANRSFSAAALTKVTELIHRYGRRLTREELAEIVATTTSSESFRLPEEVLAEVERASRPDIEWLASEFGIALNGAREVQHVEKSTSYR